MDEENQQEEQDQPSDPSDSPTPLLHAVQQSNLPLTYFYDRTPLQTASATGALPIVRALLAAGADANVPGGNNGGPRGVMPLWSDGAAGGV
ncbi:uncharacterized protein B0H64DRAFT_443347 [Chaetomium fimeti]|uniref:Uncharacterized protein n=1 Tax=Chaetomium fimeti TaxID=1854472 RepID=A0AAE0HD51_9PEZI|nr:hypothetical protein B0H64DRAFT_443347 [Chaetomium fimeti]